MTRQLAALCIAVFLCPHVFAQGPEAEWRTVTTKHFRVHYPVEYEAWSLRAASRLESVRDAVAAEVGFAPETVTDVMVTNPIAEANGLTLPLLDTPRIILYTESPDPMEEIGEYVSWVDLLAVHEVAHLLHLTRPSRNPLQRLGERFLPLNPITLGAPLWVIEGYATVVEGRITGSGRPSSTLRALILRRWAETGNLPSYAQLAGSGRFAGMSMPYLAGSAYLEWLEQRAGEGSLRKLWARMTARRRRSFNEAFIGVFGDSPERLYGVFTAELTYRAMTIDKNNPPVEGELWQETSRRSGQPDVSPDGKSIVVVLRSKTKPSRLVVWSTDAPAEEEKKFAERLEKILKRDPEDVAPMRAKPLPRKPLHSLTAPDGGDLESPRWTSGGQSILYTHRQPDRRGFLHRDLFRWIPETGENVRITHLADVGDADPMPDGQSAVAVRSRQGYSQLVMVNLLTGEVTPKTEPSLDVIYTHPRVSADGKTIAYMTHDDSGGWKLNVGRVLRPVEGPEGGPETRVPDSGGLESPPYITSPEWSGESIFATVFANGFAEIHRFNGDVSDPVTRARGGAFQPAPSPDGRLFFMSIEPDGFVVRVLPAATPVAPRVIEGELVPAIPPAPSKGISLEPQPLTPPRRYGIGRQEFSTMFGGAYASSLRVTEVGARLGDVVGRLDTIAVASIGDVRGGALASMWRGSPIGVGVHLFSFREGERHRGGELRATWRAQWPLQSIAVDAGFLADRSRDAAFGDLRYRIRQERGGIKTSEELRVGLQSHVRRALARVTLASGDHRFAAQIEKATSDDQLLPLGGIATTVMPQSLVAQRIIDPALDPATLAGDDYTGGRVELGTGYVTAFYQQHRLAGQRLGYAGLELTMQSPPIAWVKSAGFELTLGAARVRGDTRWWTGLRWRP